MKKNMGAADRVIRILVAAVFAYLFFAGIVTGVTGIVLVILGAVFVLTSLIGFCPLYAAFGLNSGRAKNNQAHNNA
jgi:fatty acid desaturase